MTQNTKDNIAIICFLLIIFNLGFMSGLIYVRNFSAPVQIELDLPEVAG